MRSGVSRNDAAAVTDFKAKPIHASLSTETKGATHMQIMLLLAPPSTESCITAYLLQAHFTW